MAEPLNILCLSSYFKGEAFLRQAASEGARVYLLTQERLLQSPWPRDILASAGSLRPKLGIITECGETVDSSRYGASAGDALHDHGSVGAPETE